MEKRVFAKFTKIPNVVGRVDYISNPKRQENLLGFFQTPENPAAFWKALSEESQDLAAYNKAQIEEHNRIENEKFEAGEIRRRQLWKTVEAREFVLCLPNDVYGKIDSQEIAKFIAEDFKARHGVECAVGVHLNKTRTNFHAHVIIPERRLLDKLKESIATRDTYYNAQGKRSTKKECLDELGNLKPGCRLVKKGEQLHQRRFSEKEPLFANKGFAYGEKVYFAKIFNQWSKDRWVVYNHYKNPHMRLYSHRREEPEQVRIWKERENSKIRLYNATIDKLIDKGELTVEQALQVKQELYAERAAEREQRKKSKEAWERWYQTAEVRKNYSQIRRNEERRIRYADSGRERTVLELLVILGMSMAGVDVLKRDRELDEDLMVRPRKNIKAVIDPKLQQMIDNVCVAAGRKAPSEAWAENKVKKLVNTDSRNNSIDDLVAAAEAIRSEQHKNVEKRPKRDERG